MLSTLNVRGARLKVKPFNDPAGSRTDLDPTLSDLYQGQDKWSLRFGLCAHIGEKTLEFLIYFDSNDWHIF